jgi:hypothetical protein
MDSSRNSNPYALFMLRDDKLMADLPPERLHRFKDLSELPQKHLSVMHL